VSAIFVLYLYLFLVLPVFALMNFPGTCCFCLFHGSTCQKEKYRLVWWHRCSHSYRPLISPIEPFNPVSRIYAPLHLHRKSMYVK